MEQFDEIMNKLFLNRTLYINGPIDDNLAARFNATLLALADEKRDEDITIYINSPGGSVSAGLSMVDTMRFISCDVRTVCVGLAASMGAILLTAGTKGKRGILPHSKVLIHQPMGALGSMTQASDFEIAAYELTRTKKELYKLISECTGQPIKKITKDCDRDHILTAEEALAHGLVDEIVKSQKKTSLESE